MQFAQQWPCCLMFLALLHTTHGGLLMVGCAPYHGNDAYVDPCLFFVQVLSNSSVSSGVGVYWMFYSGGDYEAVAAPEGLAGTAPGAAVEGLRLRPGLAMSQVRIWLGLTLSLTNRHVQQDCAGMLLHQQAIATSA